MLDVRHRCRAVLTLFGRNTMSLAAGSTASDEACPKGLLLVFIGAAFRIWQGSPRSALCNQICAIENHRADLLRHITCGSEGADYERELHSRAQPFDVVVAFHVETGSSSAFGHFLSNEWRSSANCGNSSQDRDLFAARS